MLEFKNIFQNLSLSTILVYFFFVAAAAFDYISAQLPPMMQLEDNANVLGGRWAYINSPIIEDSLGQLWIATTNGVCIHRGRHIQCLPKNQNDSTSLPVDDVRNLFIDSQNRIWVIYKNHGIKIVNTHGQIQSLLPDTLSSRLANQVVHQVFQDPLNNIWISTYDALLIRWNQTTNDVNTFPLEDAVSEREDRQQLVIQTINDPKRQEYMWLGTTKGLVELNIKTGKFSTYNFYTIANNQDTIYGTNFLRCMLLENDSTLWLGTYGGLVKFNLNDHSYQDFYDGFEYLIDNTTSILHYKQDQLIITLPDGLAFFHTKTHTLNRIIDLPLASKDYDKNCRFFRSKSGRIYLLNARLNGPMGIYYFTPPPLGIQGFATQRQQRLVVPLAGFIIFQDWNNNTILAISDDGEQEYHWPLPANKSSALREAHYINEDSVLLASRNTILLFTTKNGFQPYTQLSGLSNSPTSSLFVDSKGGIWNGRYRHGLFFLANGTNKTRLFNRLSSPPMISTDHVEDVLEDEDGIIWVLTAKGLSKYTYDSDTFFNITINELGRHAKKKMNNLVAMTIDQKNRLWVADNQKILIIDPKINQIIHVIDQTDIHEHTSIWDIETSPDGNIFITSKNNLIKINSDSFSHELFNKNIGIKNTVYDITFGSDSSLLLAHRTGFYKIPTLVLAEHANSISLPVITGFNVFDKNCDSLLFNNAPIKLLHSQNFFSFHVDAVDFSNAKTNPLSYRLKGFDSQWQRLAENQQVVSFTNIPGGQYELEIRADELSAPTDIIRQKIIIVPPFWKKNYFIAIISCLSILLLWYIANQRIKAIKRKSTFENQLTELKMKALQSQMNPHFLFNSLNSIRYHIVKNDRKEAANYLTKFSRLVRMILQNSNQDIVPLSDEIDLLELYVNIENIRFKDQIEFLVSIDERIDAQTIGIAPMIIQPFVENSIIHGILPRKTGGTIHLDMQKSGKELVVRLRDNGIGRAASMKLNQSRSLKKSSLGMQITSKRIALLKESSAVQEIEIIDLVDDNQAGLGTEVTFTLPIQRITAENSFQ